MRACPHCLSVYSVDADHCSVDGERLSGPSVLRGKSLERYTFDELLGIGGTGCVYRGHTEEGTACAIKLLFREMVGDESLTERFRREAIAVSAMDHKNVVRIFGHGATPAGGIYLVMEYLQGKTLKDILESDAPLAAARAGRIAEQMASGLGEAHRLGFVHRDLKPGNIMICRDSFGREQVKLLDFGIVASIKEREIDQRLTKTGYIVGTPTYMAPEQIDPKQVGPQVDVYALGVMLYEMLCGQPPFRGTLEQILVAKMTDDPTPIEDSGDLGLLALRFLEKDPERRPKNALQASALLAKLASDDPETVRTELPEFPPHDEAGPAPPTVRVVDGDDELEESLRDWDSDVTKPPQPRKDRWTADTRRIDFESPEPVHFPRTTPDTETPDLRPTPRPDTLIDGLPAAMRDGEIGVAPISAAIFTLDATDPEGEPEVPTEIAATPDSLFRDTDEDMPIPEVIPTIEEEPASDRVSTRIAPPAFANSGVKTQPKDAPEEDSLGDDDTALQFSEPASNSDARSAAGGRAVKRFSEPASNSDARSAAGGRAVKRFSEPADIPTRGAEAAPLPTVTKTPQPANEPLPAFRLIAFGLLVLSLMILTAMLAFDYFHDRETVIIDVPRE